MIKDLLKLIRGNRTSFFLSLIFITRKNCYQRDNLLNKAKKNFEGNSKFLLFMDVCIFRKCSLLIVGESMTCESCLKNPSVYIAVKLALKAGSEVFCVKMTKKLPNL